MGAAVFMFFFLILIKNIKSQKFITDFEIIIDKELPFEAWNFSLPVEDPGKC